MGRISPPSGLKQDERIIRAARSASRRGLAKAKDGAIYDETNDPVSSDWMVVLARILDRMFLSGVPAHYLISDPSHLQPEILRFFYIDPNWVNALVDGVLSLANHMGEDIDRAVIKKCISDYIRNTPKDQDHAPQIPEYGFYLLSDLVTMFPDLKVTTLPEPEPKGTRPKRATLLTTVSSPMALCSACSTVTPAPMNSRDYDSHSRPTNSASPSDTS
ncbi:hypothetical protein QBC38DRAFT_459576 [Podospora fimiseda]|uniref:Uncharacterized protein n=1 Tax=Podospora fimiseda TaxID=252190 RepID=A0AAN7BH88_9PEZI|nr:hypothetical protein QBC38DRAFT_459576 [Podospora fimiseda]